MEKNNQGDKNQIRQKEENITISKTTLWQGISGILGILLVLSIFTSGFGFITGNTVNIVSPTKNTVPTPSAPTPNIPNAKVIDMKLLSADAPFIGKKDAPITMVEFSDYECPFCKRFYQQTLPQIKSRYINTGKVKFVYKDFPLSFHQNAQIEAEAAHCAFDQGGNEKYFKYHDEIFKRTTSNGRGLTVDQLPVIAKDIGLNVDKFSNCLKSGKFKTKVAKGLSDGTAVGIRGTPGFIINGKLVSGAQPFNVFEQIIESELK